MADGSVWSGAEAERGRETVTLCCWEMELVDTLEEIRNIDSTISIIAELVTDLCPTEGINGDLNERGRKVQWLMQVLDDESRKLFQSYCFLMKSAGLEADYSGVTSSR